MKLDLLSEKDHDLLKLKCKYLASPEKYANIYDYLCEIALKMSNKFN